MKRGLLKQEIREIEYLHSCIEDILATPSRIWLQADRVQIAKLRAKSDKIHLILGDQTKLVKENQKVREALDTNKSIRMFLDVNLDVGDKKMMKELHTVWTMSEFNLQEIEVTYKNFVVAVTCIAGVYGVARRRVEGQRGLVVERLR